MGPESWQAAWKKGLVPERKRGKGRCLRQGKGLGEGGAPGDDNPEQRKDGSWGRSCPEQSWEPEREGQGGREARRRVLWPRAEGLEGWREDSEPSQDRGRGGRDARAWRQAWPGALTALPLPGAHPGPPRLCPRPAISWPPALPAQSQPRAGARRAGCRSCERVLRGALVGVDRRLPGAA